jgi:hypothetical protein
MVDGKRSSGSRRFSALHCRSQVGDTIKTPLFRALLNVLLFSILPSAKHQLREVEE